MIRTPEEKAAQAEYMREYRRRNPQVKVNQRRNAKIRQKALLALARLHPKEFELLVVREREKMEGSHD
jgi:hypothetical protein